MPRKSYMRNMQTIQTVYACAWCGKEHYTKKEASWCYDSCKANNRKKSFVMTEAHF